MVTMFKRKRISKGYSSKRAGKKARGGRRTKRRFSKRTRAKGSSDASVVRIGPKKDKVFRTTLRTQILPPYSASVSGINGPTWNAAGLQISCGVIFDPSGTFNVLTGAQPTISAFGSANLAPCPAQSWSNYSTLYAKYRVKKVTVTFTAYDPADLDGASPVMYIRYLNEFNTAALPIYSAWNYADITKEAGWVKKTFTTGNQKFTYSFYPKVMNLVDNGGSSISTIDTREPRNMHWTSVTTPVELYGLKILIYKPNADGSIISMDTQYSIQFKGRI